MELSKKASRCQESERLDISMSAPSHVLGAGHKRRRVAFTDKAIADKVSLQLSDGTSYQRIALSANPPKCLQYLRGIQKMCDQSDDENKGLVCSEFSLTKRRTLCLVDQILINVGMRDDENFMYCLVSRHAYTKLRIVKEAIEFIDLYMSTFETGYEPNPDSSDELPYSAPGEHRASVLVCLRERFKGFCASYGDSGVDNSCKGT